MSGWVVKVVAEPESFITSKTWARLGGFRSSCEVLKQGPEDLLVPREGGRALQAGSRAQPSSVHACLDSVVLIIPG